MSRNDSKNSKNNDGRRVARVEREVQGVVSTFIIQKLQSELPGLVTVGRVQIPADLRQARVYVSLLNLNQGAAPSDKDLEKTLDILQSWAPEMQDAIADKIQMKYLPKLSFFADESTEKILKVERILSDLGSGQTVSDDDDEF